jgi:RimJ/RimL family protein N-acetyltransferase
LSNILIQKASNNDIDKIEILYNESIDWLNKQRIHQWKKDVYPTRKSALLAIHENNLYCCIVNGNISGTFIINDNQARQYKDLNWRYKSEKILVLHTLVIKPNETGRGLGKNIMKFIVDFARINGYEAIRLDVFPDNKAAVGLYLYFGFEYVGKVFFDIKESGYEWYDCYEKLIL